VEGEGERIPGKRKKYTENLEYVRPLRFSINTRKKYPPKKLLSYSRRNKRVKGKGVLPRCAGKNKTKGR